MRRGTSTRNALVSVLENPNASHTHFRILPITPEYPETKQPGQATESEDLKVEHPENYSLAGSTCPSSGTSRQLRGQTVRGFSMHNLEVF
jgi:hypothetical protein